MSEIDALIANLTEHSVLFVDPRTCDMAQLCQARAPFKVLVIPVIPQPGQSVADCVHVDDEAMKRNPLYRLWTDDAGVHHVDEVKR
jgi:hypothetical protein